MGTLRIIVVMVLVGAVHAQGEVGRGKEGVMAYWKERMQGTRMPRVLQGMVTPMSARQVEVLHDQVVKQPNFLPAHASAFCQAAHLVCYLPSYLKRALSCTHYSQQFRRPPSSSSSSSSKVERPQHGGYFRQSLTLVAGAKIKVQDDVIKATQGGQAFLPQKLAKLFPIIGQNAISKMARMLGIPESAIPGMEDTVVDCDQNTGLQGEIKACLTSIEALADFTSSIMASSQAITTLDGMFPIPPNISPSAVHTILAIKTIQQDPNSKYLACHDLVFPFRLFYCHYIDQTRLFLATLQAQDGSKYNRVAVCHYDTSTWDPTHVSFSDIHTKPGESEACHWMRKDSIVFFNK